MPEMQFQVRWPNGAETTHYSPSLVVEDHLSEGHSYEVADFLRRSRAALDIASDRVRAKYGMPCSRASAERARIEHQARGLDGGQVTILAFRRLGEEIK